MARQETTSRTGVDYDFFAEVEGRTQGSDDGGGNGRRPESSGDGGSKVTRLAILSAIAIGIAAILALVLGRGDEQQAEYGDYLGQVEAVAADSEDIGGEFSQLVTTPGLTVEELQVGLDGLREQQAQLTRRAQDFQPPQDLHRQHESLIEAFQFRESGLTGLAVAFGELGEIEDSNDAGALLAEQSERLLTSDVVYDDLFKAGSETMMDQQGISGVPVPDSNFLPPGDADLVTAESWALIVQRLTQSTTVGGLHGNQIAGVRVRPGNQTLSAAEENTVTASDRLVFLVDVKNSGEHQETQVPVSMTLQLSPEPVRKEAVIDIINPGDTKTVTFRDINISGSFGTLVALKVAVDPVEGEANTANNTAEYSVIFTLG